MGLSGRKLGLYLSAERLAVLRRYAADPAEAIRRLIDAQREEQDATILVAMPARTVSALRLALANPQAAPPSASAPGPTSQPATGVHPAAPPQPARSAGRLCPRCTRIGRPAPACPQCAALATDA